MLRYRWRLSGDSILYRFLTGPTLHRTSRAKAKKSRLTYGLADDGSAVLRPLGVLNGLLGVYVEIVAR